MDEGSFCQPHAAAITPAAMMDGGEGKGGGKEGDGERLGERERGASITPLNLPVSAQAWMEEVGFTPAAALRCISFPDSVCSNSFWKSCG